MSDLRIGWLGAAQTVNMRPTLFRSHAMNLELDEREQATLIGLLVEVIETTQFARSPRVEAAKSLLAKLGIEKANLPASPNVK